MNEVVVAAIISGTALVFSGVLAVWISRRSEREANDVQEELSEFQILRGTVDALNTEVGRLNTRLREANGELDKANLKVDRLNRELVAAQHNVVILRTALQMNGVPIPELEPMHDV